MKESDDFDLESVPPPGMMTRSRTRRASSLGEREGAHGSENEPPPPPAMLPQVYVQYLEGPRRKVNLNESNSKSVIFELTQAIEEDSVAKITRLVEERGVDVNYKLSFGISVLLKAVRMRSVKVVDYLLTKGAEVDSSVCELMKPLDKLDNFQPLFNAQGNQWRVRTLMTMLPRLGERTFYLVDQDGRTLLHLSCFFPDATIFNYLLELGANPNIIDNKGSSVLSLLVSHRDWSVSFKMIQSVLRKPNINVDIRDNVGSTPLFQSFILKRLDVFFLLLEHGANPFVRTQAGSTLMHLPFLDCKRLMILSDLGLDVNAGNNAGKRPWQDRQRFDLVFFIMVLLGRFVTEDEFKQMQEVVEPNIVSCVKFKMQRGVFSSLRLQVMCRLAIRRHLFKVDPLTVTQAIYNLPLPNPLKVFLDVCTYAENVINSFSENEVWRRM